MIFKPSRDTHKKPEEVTIMKEKSIAQQLLKGSTNVDRMEKEIKQLISMVIGFAKHALTIPAEDNYLFKSETCTWRISCPTGSSYNSTRYLKDIAVVGVGGPHFGVSYNSEIGVTIGKDDIIAIYNDLDTFVNGMIEIFPKIENHWNYIIEASAL
jgi:hypothetical protein